jgi:hypothetical protein
LYVLTNSLLPICRHCVVQAGEALFRGPYDAYVTDVAFRRVLASIVSPRLDDTAAGGGAKRGGKVGGGGGGGGRKKGVASSTNAVGSSSSSSSRRAADQNRDQNDDDTSINWAIDGKSKLNPEKWTLAVLQDAGIRVLSKHLPVLVGRTDVNTGGHCFECSIVSLDHEAKCLVVDEAVSAGGGKGSVEGGGNKGDKGNGRGRGPTRTAAGSTGTHHHLTSHFCTACPRNLKHATYLNDKTGLETEFIQRLRDLVDPLIPAPPAAVKVVPAVVPGTENGTKSNNEPTISMLHDTR